MAAISPFRGLRYDLSVVGDLGTVTAPPYDVIPPDALERFERASPYNVVRLILARQEAGADQYTRAAETLDSWIRDGVLVLDSADRLTIYEQRFTVGGRERVQRGVIAAVEMQEESILPHERTMPSIVEDRLSLLRATRANLSPILSVYGGEDTSARDVISRVVESNEPAAAWSSADDGVEHRAWVLGDETAVAGVRRAISSATIVIADGHHRYHTAQRYRDERRAAGDGAGPWDSMLMYLVDAGWHGPALLPIHRVIDVPASEVLARIAGVMDVEPAGQTDPDALAAELEERREHGRTFALLGPDGAWWLTVADKAAEAEALPSDRAPVWRDLDVAVLEGLVVKRLLETQASYVHHPHEAAELVSAGKAGSALLLAPPPFEAVRQIAEAGEAMPPKSTFFVPKPRTGVVIRPLG